jgi:hypothetical protein
MSIWISAAYSRQYLIAIKRQLRQAELARALAPKELELQREASFGTVQSATSHIYIIKY